MKIRAEKPIIMSAFILQIICARNERKPGHLAGFFHGAVNCKTH